MTYSDLRFKPHHTMKGWHQAIAKFPNGYSASVIAASPYMVRFEVAVMHGGKIDYTTPINGGYEDVLRELTRDELKAVLADISALPKKEVVA